MTADTTSKATGSARLVYILLIISTLIGITGIIALIMAYALKDESAQWLQSHYRFQIRTFWIGLLYMMIAAILLDVMPAIAAIILLFTFIWVIIRCARGLKQLENNQAVKNVESWLFA